MLPETLFITGTGTDVGKTVISAALAHGLALLGHSVTYWKPVQAGLPADTDTVRGLCSPSVTFAQSSYVFKLPASPDQAAAAEDHAGVDMAELQAALARLPSGYRLIEGAGGLLVPLNPQAQTWADFLSITRLPVLIVAHSGLGTLNHTALTVAALRARQIPMAAIVLNGPDHPANRASLARMLPGIPLCAFPQLPELAPKPAWDTASKALALDLNRLEKFHTTDANKISLSLSEKVPRSL